MLFTAKSLQEGHGRRRELHLVNENHCLLKRFGKTPEAGKGGGSQVLLRPVLVGRGDVTIRLTLEHGDVLLEGTTDGVICCISKGCACVCACQCCAALPTSG